MIKKILLLSVITLMLFTSFGCKERTTLAPTTIVSPKGVKITNTVDEVRFETGASDNFIKIVFNKDISHLLKDDILFHRSGGAWEKAQIKATKNALFIAPPEGISLSQITGVFVVPKTALAGLENDIYIQFSPKEAPFCTCGEISSPRISGNSQKTYRCFYDESTFGLEKDIFLNKHKSFLFGNAKELHNGDSFIIGSFDGKKYNVSINLTPKEQIHATINKEYVRSLPKPLNKDSSYFVYSHRLEGYVIEEIFTRKESGKIKYVPYFPHLYVKALPGGGSDFEVLRKSTFPLTPQDIGVFETSDFTFGLRHLIHPSSFYKFSNLSENDISAVVRYEIFLKDEMDRRIENFVFPECLAGVKPSVKKLFDKDISLSLIFLSHIKESKHGKIDAKWLNSLVLDLADNIGRNAEEKQKIKKLFRYPFSDNFSVKDKNDVLNTNSDAWLYLLNLGNSEVSAPITKEIRAILNR